MLSLLFLSLFTSSSDVTSRLVFPDLKSPHYNVTVALGAAARLPCTVTNVEHQAVSSEEGGREGSPGIQNRKIRIKCIFGYLVFWPNSSGNVKCLFLLHILPP